jgi:hypothetical protein
VEKDGIEKLAYDMKAFDASMERAFNEFLKTDLYRYIESKVL